MADSSTASKHGSSTINWEILGFKIFRVIDFLVERAEICMHRIFYTEYTAYVHGLSPSCTRCGAMEELARESCVQGHHIYKEVWNPVVGEVPLCERELHKAADQYSVAITKGGVVIGHLPCKISRLCSLFLWRGGTIDCLVTGVRRYSVDLPQGGLEVPCTLLLKAKPKEIEKIKGTHRGSSKNLCGWVGLCYSFQNFPTLHSARIASQIHPILLH